MLARPLGAFDQLAPSGSPHSPPEPDGGGGVVLRHPTADRFVQQNYQWHPAEGPGPYDAHPREQYQPSYGPPGGSGGPPPPYRPSGSGRGKTLLLVGLVVLLVAGIAVGAVALTKRESNDSAQGDSPALVSALTSTGSPAPATKSAPITTTAGRASDKTPLIPGFQVVAAPSNGAAYDVPADWTIAPQDTIGGFGHPPNTVAGKGYASEGKGYCPGSTRTVAFLTGSDTADPARAATELGTKTAALAYHGTSGGTPGAPVPLASLDGSQHGVFVETTGTATEAKPGCATAYSIYTAAFPANNGTFVMVIAADTGVPHALDAETAKRICTSIRPFEG